jgi:predicted transcriptional regulator
MIEIKSGTLEARVLKAMLKQYPITIDELQAKLGISEHALKRVLKGFLTRGFISFDELPDKTYIRMNRFDFKFIGRKERIGDKSDEEMMYQ